MDIQNKYKLGATKHILLLNYTACFVYHRAFNKFERGIYYE